MKDMFIDFLIDNEVFDSFDKQTTSDIEARMLRVEPYSYLSVAMTWTDTNEGYDFWEDLNTKWRKIVCNTKPL